MFLVFHQAALGDFLLTFPLLRALDGPVALVAPWQRAALAAQVLPHVTPVDIEQFEFTRMFVPGGPTHLSPMVRELFEQTQTAISFIGAEHKDWRENLTNRLAHAKRYFVDPRPAGDGDRHITLGHRSQLEAQGLSLEPAQPMPRRNPGGPIVVHPGSGGLVKCWPTERYERLMGRLKDAGHAVVPVLGEVEAERWPGEQLTRWVDTLGAKVCRSPLELLPILTSASLYIGNDAGPTHLAAQLGITTLALFGPTSPARWGPVGPCVTVLSPPDGPSTMDWLNVEAVLDAVAMPGAR
ncbi:MAG: glycosyltransferase family 9 protein [Phycisphaerales bacterium JB063]